MGEAVGHVRSACAGCSAEQQQQQQQQQQQCAGPPRASGAAVHTEVMPQQQPCSGRDEFSCPPAGTDVAEAKGKQRQQWGAFPSHKAASGQLQGGMSTAGTKRAREGGWAAAAHPHKVSSSLLAENGSADAGKVRASAKEEPTASRQLWQRGTGPCESLAAPASLASLNRTLLEAAEEGVARAGHEGVGHSCTQHRTAHLDCLELSEVGSKVDAEEAEEPGLQERMGPGPLGKGGAAGARWWGQGWAGTRPQGTRVDYWGPSMQGACAHPHGSVFSVTAMCQGCHSSRLLEVV